MSQTPQHGREEPGDAVPVPREDAFRRTAAKVREFPLAPFVDQG